MAKTRTYAHFCPVARSLEVIGEKWSLLIVRDLLTGPKRFKDLEDGLPGIPTNVLSARLKELEDAGVVRRQLLPRPAKGVGYELTDYGRELEEPLMKLGLWGAKSLGPAEEGLPVSLPGLALGLQGAFHPDVAAGLTRTYALTLDGATLHISLDDGRLSITAEADGADVALATTPALLLGLISGRVRPDDAIAAGQLTVRGSKAEARRFFRIFQLSSPAVP